MERIFSDVPEPRDMSWFGIGYRIVYVDDAPGGDLINWTLMTP